MGHQAEEIQGRPVVMADRDVIDPADRPPERAVTLERAYTSLGNEEVCPAEHMVSGRLRLVAEMAGSRRPASPSLRGTGLSAVGETAVQRQKTIASGLRGTEEYMYNAQADLTEVAGWQTAGDEWGRAWRLG